MKQLDKHNLISYCEQALNMALAIDGETTYTNSFECLILQGQDGVFFLPRLPAGYVLDDALYQRIFLILNASLYPFYTLVKQPSAYFVPFDSDDIHTARAFFFPWLKGIPERLMIPDLEAFARQEASNQKIPIMTNNFATLNVSKMTSALIAGTSGGGKSYFLEYLMTMLAPYCRLVIIDPKNSSPARWGRAHGVTVVTPADNRSKSDFVSQVNDKLKEALEIIHKRQAILSKTPDYTFTRHVVVIDEVLALSEGVQKAVKEAFFSLLSEIALLGRETQVGTILCSQRFDNKAISLSVREQANVLVQVGNINSKTTQFLFPDLNPEGIVIPSGKGTGLIQIIDDEHPFQVLPLLTPTYYYKTKGGNHA